MTRLLLMRHAKAERGTLHDDDHGRRLADRGRRDAPVMAARLAEAGLVPDLILASDAARTRETAMLVAEVTGVPDAAVRFEPTLYLAAADHLLAMAAAAGAAEPSLGTIMVVAHNPGLEQLVNRLSGSLGTFPTAAIAVVRPTVASWTEVPETEQAEVRVLRPKDGD